MFARSSPASLCCAAKYKYKYKYKCLHDHRLFLCVAPNTQSCLWLIVAIRPFHNSFFSSFKLWLSSKFLKHNYYRQAMPKLFGQPVPRHHYEMWAVAQWRDLAGQPWLVYVRLHGLLLVGRHLGRASSHFRCFSAFSLLPLLSLWRLNHLLPSFSFLALRPVGTPRICHHFNREVIARVNRVSVILLLLH